MRDLVLSEQADSAQPVVGPHRWGKTAAKVRGSWLAFVRGLKGLSARQWRKIALALAGFIGVTIGFVFISNLVLTKLNLPLNSYAGISYLTVFLVFLVSNLTLFTPLPLAMTVLVTTALTWNPAVLGLAAALGATIGELSGYVAGMLGRKMFIRENFMCSLNSRFCNSRLNHDIQRYGPLAISILAVQPILPFDVAGIIAGSLKMNFLKFFVALLIGKTLKYILIAYSAGVLSTIPFMK